MTKQESFSQAMGIKQKRYKQLYYIALDVIDKNTDEKKSTMANEIIDECKTVNEAFMAGYIYGSLTMERKIKNSITQKIVSELLQ